MRFTPCSISNCKSCWRSPVRERTSTQSLPHLYPSPSHPFPTERAKRPADGGQAQGGEAAELRTSLLALVSQKPHNPRDQRNARRSSSRHHREHRKPEWKCRKCSTFSWERHANAVSTMRVPQPGQSKREGAGRRPRNIPSNGRRGHGHNQTRPRIKPGPWKPRPTSSCRRASSTWQRRSKR